MVFGRRKKSWEDEYDEDYTRRADRDERRARRSSTWIHCFGLTVALTLVLAAIWLIAGKIMLEKTLTGLASPIGFAWLGLLLIVYFGFLFRQSLPAWIALAIWLVITIFGNGFVTNQIAYGLENQFLDFDYDQMQPLDVLFVLGGGTTTNLLPMEELNAAGDRVVTAARLFHAGKVNTIVCTGKQWQRTNAADLDPNEEAARLLAALKVPTEKIARIAGRNTSEEMENIVKFLEQQNLTTSKVGIITSAWHLNRAGRLANKNGIEATLVPCDFRSHHFSIGTDIFLPSAHNLDVSAACIKEYLAGLIGR